VKEMVVRVRATLLVVKAVAVMKTVKVLVPGESELATVLAMVLAAATVSPMDSDPVTVTVMVLAAAAPMDSEPVMAMAMVPVLDSEAAKAAAPMGS
jgi:hypothetical protein